MLISKYILLSSSAFLPWEVLGAWASEGGPRPPQDFEIWHFLITFFEGCFLVCEWWKSNFATFSPLQNIFGPLLQNPLLALPGKKIPALMFRGTCSSIEMLKGYMDRESLGTPDIQYVQAFYKLFKECGSVHRWWKHRKCFCPRGINLEILCRPKKTRQKMLTWDWRVEGPRWNVRFWGDPLQVKGSTWLLQEGESPSQPSDLTSWGFQAGVKRNKRFSPLFLQQWFLNCGTRTTSGARGLFGWNESSFPVIFKILCKSIIADVAKYKTICKNLFLCYTNVTNSFVCWSKFKNIWANYILLKPGGTYNIKKHQVVRDHKKLVVRDAMVETPGGTRSQKLLLDREPRGSKSGGKVTNFYDARWRVLAKFKYYPDVHDKQRYDLGVLLGHCRVQPCQLMESQRHIFLNSAFNVYCVSFIYFNKELFKC